MAELLYQTTINKEQKDYIEIISRSSEDMIGLVNNAIDFSKLSNSTLTLLPSEIDLIESIELSISTISAKAAEKNLKFSFTTDFDLPSFVVADSTRLMQVIEILISNAIKFTYTGSVHLEATQLLRNSSEVTLQFKVTDTGPGIEEFRKKNTFKTFFQIDESATTRSRGTGLGLVIAKHIVEMMNGTIDFESCPGEGSVFWFKVTLPICQTPKNFIPSNSTPGTIAIIDPDNTAYTTLSQYLKFDNPQSSISKYSSINNISLLSDFDLIIINGENINYSLLKKMHSESSKTPIVNITSKPEDNTNQNPLFTQTLTRPFSRQSVINKLAGINKEKPEEKRVNFSFVDPHGLHVLVVDDNQINQKVATKMLTHLGCTAEVANNGFDALSMLSCNRYELVLLDLQMPLIDGYGVISEIRNPSSTVLDHEVPVIAMTALNSEEDRKKCHDSGMNSFIVKPITVSELNLVIESSFRNHSFFKNISENDGVVS
jgi:CheY-like chemotaxis protein